MDKKLIWHTETRRVDELVPYDKNPRKISEKQISDLKKSLRRFNLVEIPAIDKDSKIIAGHQRLKVLQLLGRGEEEIDVRVPNRKLTDKEYKQYLITSNAVTGDWDYDLLKDFDIDFLTDIGFDDNLLSDIWDNDIEIGDEEFDEEKELEKIKDPKTKTGDLITLGKHRLICGDSNDPNTVKRLFGNERASMLMCDPPYNINLSYSKGLGGKQNYGAEVIDNRTEKEYVDFVRTNLFNGLKIAKTDTHIFYWNTEQQIWMVQNLYREMGIKNKRVCLWIKNGHNPTPQVAFNKCYEPCIYGTIGKPYISKKKAEISEILNQDVGSGNESLNQINIWTSKRIPKSDYKHATSKPTDLYDKPIKRCTKPGDIIYDSFGGSGSSLISAESLKRKVYTIEQQPIFCDLIINRYEKLTGLKTRVIREDEKA